MAEKEVVGSQEQPASAGQTGHEIGASRTIVPVATGCVTVTGDSSTVLQTATIGSGVAVVLYDLENKVGGVLHFLMPDGSIDEPRGLTRPGLFADRGLELLLLQMKTRRETKFR